MDTWKVLSISRAIGALRDAFEYSDMPAQMIQILLEVAALGELPQQDLEKKVGISKSAISRFLSSMADGTSLKPGLRVLESFEEPDYRRRKLVRITPVASW